MNNDNKKLPIEEYLDLFEPTVHDAIRASLSREGVSGAACMVNHVFEPGKFGRKVSMIFGPGCTFKSIEQIERQSNPGGIYTNGQPSSASFPEGYVEK